MIQLTFLLSFVFFQEDEVEEDDFNLKADDNLILVGRTEEDGAIMEVYGESFQSFRFLGR